MPDCPDDTTTGHADLRDAFAGALGSLSRRTLSDVMPPLSACIREGDRVLDVGCGPGSITLDVARLVHGPAEVTGVDHSPSLIAAAQGEAERAGVRNAKFLIGDARHLSLPQDAFDLTYSHALLDWLDDPVAALREQARVTRRGGIVFARMSDLSSQTYFPACPDVTCLVAALHALASTDPGQVGWNPFLGARAAELLRGAGLEIMGIRPWSTCFRSIKPDVNRHLVEGLLLSGAKPPYSKPVRALLEKGLVDSHSLARARDQVGTLMSDPHGLSIRSGVYALGQVP